MTSNNSLSWPAVIYLCEDDLCQEDLCEDDLSEGDLSEDDLSEDDLSEDDLSEGDLSKGELNLSIPYFRMIYWLIKPKALGQTKAKPGPALQTPLWLFNSLTHLVIHFLTQFYGAAML